MKKETGRYLMLGAVVVLIIAAIIVLEKQKPSIPAPMAGDEQAVALKAGKYPLAPDLAGIQGWINTEPLSLKDLKGKVVIIDFWTYSCINCLRTLPYLVAWDEKYRDKGLVIVGVHTPEFEFEKKYENVEKFVNERGIKYPVVLDNDYATWSAYRNKYWPRKYIIDRDGFIRYDHIGEGGYKETEAVIQELLAEGTDMEKSAYVNVADETPTTRNTPELYLGYGNALPRFQNLGNEGSFAPEKEAEYVIKDISKLDRDVVYLSGIWKAEKEKLTAGSDSALYLKFTAMSANIVVEPVDGGTIEVTLDGRALTPEQAGSDVTFADGKSIVLVNEPRLYNLYKGAYGTFVLRLSPTSGVGLNAFTFG